MTQHYVVFIGATPSLSTELNGLAKRIRSCVVVAPAMKKGQTVVCEASVAAYAKMLYAELAKLTQSYRTGEIVRCGITTR